MPLSQGQSSSSKGIRAGSAYIALSVSKDQYDADLQRAQDQLRAFDRQARKLGKWSLDTSSLKGFSDSLNRIGGNLSSLGKTWMRDSALVLGGFTLALREFMTEGDKLDKASKRMGVSPEWLSGIQFAAERSGASIEDVERAVRTLARTLSTAQGISAASSLGFDAGVLRRMPPQKSFEVILEAIGRLPNAFDRARIAMELFGKAGTGVIPMAGDMRSLVDEASKLGLVWSKKDVEMAARLSDAWTTLTFALKRVVAIIGGALAPVIVDWSRRLSQWASALGKFIDAHPGLVRMIASFYALKFAAGAAMWGLGGMLKTLGSLPALISMLSHGIGYATFGFWGDMATASMALLKSIFRLAGAFPVLGTAIKTAGSVAAASWKLMLAPISHFPRLFATAIKGISNASWMGKALTMPFTGLSKALGLVAAGAKAAAKPFRGLGTAIGNFLTGIYQSYNSIRSLGFGRMSSLLTALQGMFVQFGHALKNTFNLGSIGRGIVKMLSLPSPVLAGWVALGLAIAAVGAALWRFTSFGETIKNAFSSAVDWVKNAFRSVGSYLSDLWSDLVSRMREIAPVMRNAMSAAFGGIGAGEWRKSFALMWDTFALAALTAFQDAIVGASALRAYVAETGEYIQDDFARIFASMSFGWDFFVQAFKDSVRWFKEDAKRLSVSIGGFFSTLGKTLWESMRWAWNAIAEGFRKAFAEVRLLVSEVVQSVILGFKKAYYWSKRILPGYGEKDYAADVEAAEADYVKAIEEAAERRDEAFRKASEAVPDGIDVGGKWSRGMDELRRRLDEIDAASMESDRLSTESMRSRLETYRRTLAEIDEMEERSLEAIDRGDVAFANALKGRIGELRKQVEAETAELKELVETKTSESEDEFDSYLPEISENVGKIAAAVGATATYSAQEASARWGGLSAFSTPLREAWIRAGTTFGTSARDAMRRAAQDIDEAMRKATLPYTASATNSEEVERLLGRLVNESVRQSQNLNRYANGVSQMLTFA